MAQRCDHCVDPGDSFKLMATRHTEEPSSDDISEGSEFTSGPVGPRTGGPFGPPTPRPVQDEQPLSHHLSHSVFTALQQRGITLRSALTVIPWGLEGCTDVTIEVRPLTPGDTFHPNLLHFEDDPPQDEHTADDAEVFLPGPTSNASIAVMAVGAGTTAPTTTSMVSGSTAAASTTVMPASTMMTSARPMPKSKAEPRANTNRKLEPHLPLQPSLDVLPETTADVKLVKQAGSHSGEFVYGRKCERCTRKDTRPTRLVPRQQQRLRIVTWNCGGLSGPRYHEVITWLRDEHQAGRTVDICCLQETHWKEEMEYTTADEAGELAWHVVHYPGKDSSGLMCLVRAGLVPPTHIRTVCLVPGRVVHLRLCFQVPLDVLCMYQYSWNTQKLELTGTHKVEALLKQRRQIWRTLDQWLQGIPQRHGCVVLGDLNTPLIPDDTVAGSGVVSDRAGQQQDQQELQELLRNHRCCALNTWARRGSTARTFIPPSTKGKEPGSQIDFVITRGNLLDPEAKRARPVATPFVPTSGGRHRPVIATIPLPTRPTTKAGDNHGLRPRQIRKVLADTTMATQVGEAVRNRLECMQPTDAIDDQLLEGWRAVRGQFPTNDSTRPVPCPQHATLTVCVRHLWQLRDDVRKATQTLGTWTSPRRMATRALQAWVLLFRMNSHNRELRKECRRRKTNRIEEVVLSDNIHQAAKRFAPKAPRKRLQLRDANGGIQTHEAEFEQIKTYFAKLYAGPVPDQVVLSKGPLISVDEVLAAMHRLQAGKAMPHKSAPAALWKHFSQEVAPILSAQFNLYLAPGTTSLPRSWCISDLILIPKPGKAMKTPGDLRPLSLLSLPAKALASVVASRLQEYVIRYLREVPQFAYVPGRTLAQALERVFAHCAAVRVALQQGHNTVHAKRQGHKMASICGGCMLSLDVSKAYDCVSRQHLEAALRDAEVPEYLIELTLLIHHTACLRISHCELETVLPTFRGLRQGCSLSPTLWALLTGWMLRQMEDPGVASIMSANTTYADDQHYAWQVGSGLELEAAYAAMKHILHSLRRFGLQISADKTVILMELRGLHAHKALQRYVVDMPQGKCVKFLLDGEATYIRIVTSHVYLGAVIGYHKFETDTLQHRMKLAKGVYSRLGNILRHRSLPLRLRLLLWQGCVWPTLLHALDSSGLPGKDLNTMLVLLLKQARSIARSHSMLTKETNRSIIDRLRLPDPVRPITAPVANDGEGPPF
ncbi:unnamed protein product [Symbiodinium sp. CCMP2592]|nr:unnamed protein product [Symbiodinium sp. CCMP2592]